MTSTTEAGPEVTEAKPDNCPGLNGEQPVDNCPEVDGESKGDPSHVCSDAPDTDDEPAADEQTDAPTVAAVHLYEGGVYSHSHPEVMTPSGARRFAETYNEAGGKYVALAVVTDLVNAAPRYLGVETFTTVVRIVHILRDGKYSRTLPHVFDSEGGDEYLRRFNATSEGTGVVAVLTEHVVGGVVPSYQAEPSNGKGADDGT